MITLFFIGKNDFYHAMLQAHLERNENIVIGKQLTPNEEFNIIEAENFDIIVVDVEEKNFGFEDLELLQTVIEIYPQKNVIAFTETLNPAIAAKVAETGAKGYFYRTANDLHHVSNVIQSVYEGATCFQAN